MRIKRIGRGTPVLIAGAAQRRCLCLAYFFDEMNINEILISQLHKQMTEDEMIDKLI